MPWYDLMCGACGEVSEAFQMMAREQPTRCLKCGKNEVRRVLLKAPAVFDTYPEGHPRKNRGRHKQT